MKTQILSGLVLGLLALPVYAADATRGAAEGADAAAGGASIGTSPDTAKAVKSFTTLDINSDGAISMSEAKTMKTLTQKFKNADINQDGKIQEAEYVRFSMDE